MNGSACRWTQEKLSAYHDGALSSPEMEKVKQHLAGCEECREEFELLATITAQLSGLPRLKPDSHFAERIVSQALREQGMPMSERLVMNLKNLQYFMVLPRAMAVMASLAAVLLCMVTFRHMKFQESQLAAPASNPLAAESQLNEGRKAEEPAPELMVELSQESLRRSQLSTKDEDREPVEPAKAKQRPQGETDDAKVSPSGAAASGGSAGQVNPPPPPPAPAPVKPYKGSALWGMLPPAPGESKPDSKVERARKEPSAKERQAESAQPSRAKSAAAESLAAEPVPGEEIGGRVTAHQDKLVSSGQPPYRQVEPLATPLPQPLTVPIVVLATFRVDASGKVAGLDFGRQGKPAPSIVRELERWAFPASETEYLIRLRIASDPDRGWQIEEAGEVPPSSSSK